MSRKVYLRNTSREKAQELFFDVAAGKNLTAEEIPVQEAVGRVTAEPVFARISTPHYHASAMDGIAVKASATFGASPTSPVKLVVGENAFYIDTGGILPQDCDAVIMIEDVFPCGDSEQEIEIREPATPWQHVRSIGEDIVSTEMILPSYHYIKPFDVGALINGGIFSVKVLKKPLVALLPTGSELVSPGKLPEAGEILDSNSYTFESAVHQWGGEALRFPLIRDSEEELESALLEASSKADLVLISAGSSAGRKDFTSQVVEKIGHVLVHGTAIRPGKPVVLGEVESTPVIGLPGYPVAAFICLELFVKPLLYRWRKQEMPAGEYLKAYSSRKIISSLKEEEYLRVKIGKVDDKFVVTPLPRGAGVNMSLVRADGLAIIPQNKEGVQVGEELTIELWRSRQEVENTILCLGSHDLSLDILADHLRKKGGGYALSSAHVGSMGGIMSLKREEAHIAGVHLLDEASGTYNIPYLKHYLAEKDITLIHLAKRELGLIVAPGNPRGIKGLQDLLREDILFVNRQKGAGTRMFLDFSLREMGYSPSQIRGYEREEFNHLAVAASVATGSADAGLGIRAAAKALGMDFIPLAEEDYELAVPSSFVDSTPCRALIEVMLSPAFQNAVEGLGGYNLEKCGAIVWSSGSAEKGE